MGILEFIKPTKAVDIAEWKKISADGAPPGVYTPNMSDADRRRYKANIVGGECPRVEVRVSLGSEVLIKVKAHQIERKFDYNVSSEERAKQDKRNKLAGDHGSKHIKISMNGPMELTIEEWEKFKTAIDEAIELAPKG
jgi:hypothetical protein